MRNLTIKRTKSFVACAARMKVYIEDPAAGDTTICGVVCRKLGDLKNGASETFLIGEDSAKLFVIADKLSSGFCNAVCQLPAGSEDLQLAGKNRFSPFMGNPFHFDNAPELTDPVIDRRRKRGRKIGIAVIILILLVSFALGICIGSGMFRKAKPKVYTAGELSVTLTDDFQPTNVKDATAFSSKDTTVIMTKENHAALRGMSVDDYAAAVISSSATASSAVVSHEDGLTYFEYEVYLEDLQRTVRYLAFCYRNGNDYWMVQFAANSSRFSSLRPTFFTYAKTVQFS